MITHKYENGTLTVNLKGELDHHSVSHIRAETDELLTRFKPKEAVLDFGDVTFCDSSGIAYVMGRYRLISSSGGTMRLNRVPKKIMTIFTMAGLEKLVQITEKEETQ